MNLPLRSLLAAFSAAVLFASSQASLGAEKSQSKPPVINGSDKKALAAHIGKEVSVEGLVLSVGKGDKDGVRFLDLGEKLRTGFVVAIFPSAYKKVGPVKNYQGKNVRVTGKLETYKKQTQIKVFKASQIQVLDTPAADPAKKK